MISLRPQKGHLLVAEPSIIGDVSFNRAVVTGRPLTKRIYWIYFKQTLKWHQRIGFWRDKPFKVFNGGPVEQDTLFHPWRPDLIENSVEISMACFGVVILIRF